MIKKHHAKNSETYESYDYFKEAYKHNAEHDVAKKTSQF